MISLQSHNQVLYHLSQLAAAFTPRSPNYSTRIKQNDEKKSASHEHICQESFEEAAKSCAELSLENLDLRRLPVGQRLTKKRIRVIFNHLNAIDRVSRPINDENIWKVSYLSGANFNENKRGFPCSTLSTPIIFAALGFTPDKFHRTNDHLWLSTTSTNVPVRGFKTNRNVEADENRNPTLATRFREWIGLPKHKEHKLRGIERADLENLKKLFNGSELTPDEKQHVKVAFAEGYIAGNEKKVTGRGFKWLSMLRSMSYIIAGFVAFIVLVSMYQAKSTGSMFRITLGGHSAVGPEESSVTFDDVKGVDEAKKELIEIVEFLKNPDKFSALGGRLPKGVLLVGPPGTGKTLLARAVAGEAQVPFFHAAGAEFDEVLVGQGARRVRDLFKAAKERAPCVIFLDEIDSVGGKRTTSVIHPYANQTINQLLSEMDGFHQNEGVIVLGATNRRDDLDQALRRPGRFDVEVFVHKPDFKGRKEILEYYLSKILTQTVDVELLARTTLGFTGADIQSMVNQAALRAASEGAEYVTMDHLQAAREKVILGPELRGRMPDGDENRITAYHEAGHALVGFYTKESHPLNKVTIIPRGSSLGHTSFVSEKDIYHETKSKLLARMDTAFGGRAAEELIFGIENVTTGASSDLQVATRIAEAMVKNYGMSEKVGFRTETQSNGNNGSTEYSPNTTEVIDAEIKRILQESYERAKTILKVHAKEHKLLAEALLKYETIDIEDVKKILIGKKNETDIKLNVADKRTPIIDVPTNVM